MKNYKEYEKVCIGGSDIAEIIVRQPLEVKTLGTGEDGTYYAYIIDTEEDVEIGGHYTKVYESNHWLWIYDDKKRVLQLNGNYDVYNSGKTFIFKQTKKHNFDFIYDKSAKDYIKIQFYDIQDIEKLEKELCSKENCGKVIILKNAENKYIKGLVYKNCISIGSYCKEYDTIEECVKTSEERITGNSIEHITGMEYTVEIKEINNKEKEEYNKRVEEN